MGSKYELTLSADYVPEWGLNEALREIFQNAYDQEKVSGEASYYDYDPKVGLLRVVSPKSWLNRSTLLLGVSSKKDDEKQIGQFGEGYKLACLVFARLGLDVWIENKNFKEVWKPFLKSSRRFSGEEVLMFDVEGKLTYKHTDDKDLVFNICGIAEGDWEFYKRFNLNLAPPENIIKSGDNSVLLEDKYAGKVYVSGLYVADMEGLQYGYNLSPENISLDRDRRTLPTFDILWETSKIWENSGDMDIVLQLCRDGVEDVKYLTPNLLLESSEMKSTVVQDFKEKYGQNAYPVSTNEELVAVQQLEKDKIPVIVEEPYKKLLKATGEIENIDTSSVTTLRGQMETWFERVKGLLPEEEVEAFNTLLTKVPKYLQV